MADLYPLLRDLQARFPALLETKVSAQRFARRIMGRPFEADFNILKNAQLLDGECMLDIGANRGQSIDAMRLFEKTRKIVAFEPNGLMYERLKGLFPRDENLDLINSGLATVTQAAPLYVPTYRGFMYDGLASFDRSEAESWLNADTVANFDPALLKIEDVTCRTEPLDGFRLRPGFVKIDVQGYEADVLAGGEDTIRTHRPLILLENNEAADNLLSKWGFHRMAYEGRHVITGVMGSGNTLYMHPEAQRIQAKVFWESKAG